MHELEKKICNAREKGRIAVIPFITAGFPNRKNFWKHLAELDAEGADIIEIGIPFSDPVADGPVVEDASRRSLAEGISLAEILSDLKVRKGSYKAGIVLMGYMNPFLRYGLDKLAKDANDAGVSGLIVPDLPHEESETLKKHLKEYDMALLPLIALNTTPKRMALYAKDAKGYVYVVSVMGTTGERQQIPDDAAKIIAQARQIFNVPIALGFGLRHPDQLLKLPEQHRPDAAVFGSALLKHLDDGNSAGEFLKPWLLTQQ